MPEITRCKWPGMTYPLYIKYHDEEWGVPQHDDIKLFEALILDGFQAGLSWFTILKKREGYRKAFDGFSPEKISTYDDKKVEELMADTRIVRNRLKILSAIGNAKSFLEIRDESGSFDRFIWSFVKHNPIKNHWDMDNQIPSKTVESDLMIKELYRRGSKFVGSTICYAFMQGVGMVNDHVRTCFRYEQV